MLLRLTPIIITFDFGTNAPALSTDNYTFVVTSDTDQAIGTATEVPGHSSLGDVTVAVSGSTMYTITELKLYTCLQIMWVQVLLL